MALFQYGLPIIPILVLILLYMIGTSAFALPAVDTGHLDQTYNLTIANQTYPIRYGFSAGSSGMVDSMVANVSSKSITIIVRDYGNDSISDWQKRVVSIELPRNIINANTTEIGQGCSYSVGGKAIWNQEHDLDYNIDISSVGEVDAPSKYISHFTMETCDFDTRTLSVEYPRGESTIVIQGTVIVPEFASTFASLIMTAGMVGVIVASIATIRVLRRHST